MKRNALACTVVAVGGVTVIEPVRLLVPPLGAEQQLGGNAAGLLRHQRQVLAGDPIEHLLGLLARKILGRQPEKLRSLQQLADDRTRRIEIVPAGDRFAQRVQACRRRCLTALSTHVDPPVAGPLDTSAAIILESIAATPRAGRRRTPAHSLKITRGPAK